MPIPFRILLVNAVGTHSWMERRQPSMLGLGYLMSSVRHAIPDTTFEFRVVDENVRQAADQFKPQLVGISFVSQNVNIALRYAEEFERRRIPVVMGGVHISVIPRCLPKSAMAACRGEGEQTFVELVKAAMGGNASGQNLKTIQGIAYWEGDTLVQNEDRSCLADLDSLPFPDRSLFPIYSHTPIFTSRGCPYRCTFCSTARFWDKVRFNSAGYIADEIDLLVRQYGAKFISFYDDLFIAKIDRIEALIRLLEKRRLLNKIGFSCNCRANLVNHDLAAMLVRLGVKYVTMGLESGDEQTLRYLKGDNVTVAQNRDAIRILREHGLRTNAYIIIGAPRETGAQIMNTYNFIRQYKPDLVEVNILAPFPGTPVWDYAKSRNLVSEESFDWNKLNNCIYNNTDNFVLLSEVLDRATLIRYYKKLRRLQFRRNLCGIYRHPLLIDIARMLINIIPQYCRQWLHLPSRSQSLAAKKAGA
ncbi:MAG: radical SAM protein [Kiritimatiellae bacterium]|nr:radical SAM protein [Kiritimatiellia bacterium]